MSSTGTVTSLYAVSKRAGWRQEVEQGQAAGDRIVREKRRRNSLEIRRGNALGKMLPTGSSGDRSRAKTGVPGGSVTFVVLREARVARRNLLLPTTTTTTRPDIKLINPSSPQNTSRDASKAPCSYQEPASFRIRMARQVRHLDDAYTLRCLARHRQCLTG